MPAASEKTVTGRVDSVPCPHCGKGNDFREVIDMLAPSGSVGASAESGQLVECDHCDQKMEVVNIVKTTLVSVRQPQ